MCSDAKPLHQVDLHQLRIQRVIVNSRGQEDLIDEILQLNDLAETNLGAFPQLGRQLAKGSIHPHGEVA